MLIVILLNYITGRLTGLIFPEYFIIWFKKQTHCLHLAVKVVQLLLWLLSAGSDFLVTNAALYAVAFSFNKLQPH